jgi:hypothetical protein
MVAMLNSFSLGPPIGLDGAILPGATACTPLAAATRVEDRSQAVILVREEWPSFGQGKIIAGEVVPGFGFRLSLPVREAPGGLAIGGRLMASAVWFHCPAYLANLHR